MCQCLVELGTQPRSQLVRHNSFFQTLPYVLTCRINFADEMIVAFRLESALKNVTKPARCCCHLSSERLLGCCCLLAADDGYCHSGLGIIKPQHFRSSVSCKYFWVLSSGWRQVCSERSQDGIALRRCPLGAVPGLSNITVMCPLHSLPIVHILHHCFPTPAECQAGAVWSSAQTDKRVGRQKLIGRQCLFGCKMLFALVQGSCRFPLADPALPCSLGLAARRSAAVWLELWLCSTQNWRAVQDAGSNACCCSLI